MLMLYCLANPNVYLIINSERETVAYRVFWPSTDPWPKQRYGEILPQATQAINSEFAQ